MPPATPPDLPARAAPRLPRRAGGRVVALLAAVLLLVPGCINHVPHTTVMSVGGKAAGARIDAAPMPQRIAALTGEIRRLSPTIDPAEAASCADGAVRYAKLLAVTYDIHQPVELHNVLVNLGIKKRGLCYQLADDLDDELLSRHYRTLEFRRGVAWEGDLWNEHNCVVVTAVGQPFDRGIVLDAWRLAPVLRWAPVKRDYYPWVPKVYADETYVNAGGAAVAKPAGAVQFSRSEPVDGPGKPGG